jgi:hypothetical protein
MNRVDHETSGIGVDTITPGDLLPGLNIAPADILFHTTSVTVVGTPTDVKGKLRHVDIRFSRHT